MALILVCGNDRRDVDQVVIGIERKLQLAGKWVDGQTVESHGRARPARDLHAARSRLIDTCGTALEGLSKKTLKTLIPEAGLADCGGCRP